jgi:hypothetical protein
VSGDDAPPAVIESTQDEDDAEMRQLVVSEADRRPAQGVEDVVERIGMDRRRQAIPDRRGTDRDPRRFAPGVGGRVVGELEGQQDRRVGTDRIGVGGRVRLPRPAKLRRLGQPVEGLALTRQFHDPNGGWQEVEQCAESGRFADPLIFGGDDDRDACLDEQPQLRSQLGIEHC